MPTLVPVDGDPFAAAAPTPAAATPTPTPQATAAGPRLVPVDHDPFASGAPTPTPAPAPAIPTMRIKADVIPQTGDVPSQQEQPTGNFFAGAHGPPAALAPIVQAAAAKYGVPLAVANWVGQHESNWNPAAIGPETSHGRAQGAWQFMEGTAKEMNLADPHDFATSTDAAMRYLRQLADRNGGDWTKAVEAYGTFSTGMGPRRDAAAKAGFQEFLGNTGTTKPAAPERGNPASAEDEDPDFPQDAPGRYYGMLPFSEDETTHEKTWGVGQSEIVRSLARGWNSLDERMHQPALTPYAARPLTGDELGTVLTAGGMPTGAAKMFAPTGAARVAADAAAATAATNKAALGTANEVLGYGRTPEGKAARVLGKRVNQDVQSSSYYRPEVDYDVPGHAPGPMPPLALATGPADEVVGNLNRMRESGLPANIIHAAGPNTEGLAGKISRQPGAAQGIIRGGLKDIDAGAQGRNEAAVGALLTKGSSAYRTTLDLLQARSVEGKPLWDKALQGGSIAPLEQQFQTEWAAASRAARAAEQEVEVANSQLNAALAKQPVSRGNDYSDSAANSAVRAARARVNHAENAAATARADADEVRQMMQRAQADRANGTPGAVWNPRIQRMLERPKVKEGLRLGYEIQADEAAARGIRLNTTEFAMTPDGDIISVPNMRTLHAAKVGLDQMYSDTLDEFGRPSSAGVAIDEMRRSLLREMDAINPDYKTARAAWAGKSASLDAVAWGKGIDKISPEQVAQEFSNMGPGEQEFARLAVADRLLTKIGDTSFGADEAKNLLKNPNMRDRLQPIFRTQDEFVRYVAQVADERRMYDVNTRLVKNSETAARRVEDNQQDLSTAGHVAHAVSNLAHGRVLRAIGSGTRAAREFILRPNPQVDEALARMMMDQQNKPNVVNGKIDFSPLVHLPPP